MNSTSKITSVITFGLLLLVISLAFSFSSYKIVSHTLAKMGLLFEVYALALYLMNRFKKSKNG